MSTRIHRIGRDLAFERTVRKGTRLDWGVTLVGVGPVGSFVFVGRREFVVLKVMEVFLKVGKGNDI